MFLFTTPGPSPAQRPAEQQTAAQGEHPIARPVRAAAEATGVSFDYLMQTAKRESGLNPAAKAQTSSATGLFQFIEQTWLGLVKREGAGLGLKDQAEAIQRDGAGRYVVPDQQARRQILDMRSDPELSARLAGVFTQKNRESLREAIGRDPNAGELYMAHFLGAQGASELISRATNNPEGSAARAFPDAAAANRPIFFDGKGNARTNREVYARLAAMHQGIDALGPASNTQVAAVDAPVEAPTRSPLAIGQGGVARSDNALHGLFRGGGDNAAANSLRKTWSGFAEARINRNAPSFFPRANDVAALPASAVANPAVVSDATPSPLAGFEAIAPSEALVPVDAPLPPIRPKVALGESARSPLDLVRHRLKR